MGNHGRGAWKEFRKAEPEKVLKENVCCSEVLEGQLYNLLFPLLCIFVKSLIYVNSQIRSFILFTSNYAIATFWGEKKTLSSFTFNY